VECSLFRMVFIVPTRFLVLLPSLPPSRHLLLLGGLRMPPRPLQSPIPPHRPVSITARGSFGLGPCAREFPHRV